MIPNSKASEREGSLSEMSWHTLSRDFMKKKEREREKNLVVFGNKTRLSNRGTWERICSQGGYFTAGTVGELMCLTRDTTRQREVG